ncbi:phage holin family protein [uncultured Thermanaerothrix sp.]|uniref:phage holin family protein n=1 Tax=uncultured Thermanaerothrix sp. TaxID=1195149 RepID=UPI0026332EB6|nr:phage holin family protein [uncultured Thermanaerothrix sp.]
MKRFLIRLFVTALAFYVAVALLSPQYIQPSSSNWLSFIWLALIFGVINAIVRPILIILGCPFIILTLGLGILVINTALFALAGWIGNQFGVGFTVSGFWGAFLGSLVVSIILFISQFFIEDMRKK